MKKLDKSFAQDLNIEQLELKGFSRSITEVELLTLILVILYAVVPGIDVEHPFGLYLSMLAYSFFILGFNYINLQTPHFPWKIALESWVLIAFITWVTWNTGRLESPLFNLYLLVIVASAITMNKVMTLLQLGFVLCFYLYFEVTALGSYSFGEFSELMVFFSPYVLVGYITAILASDVNYGKMMFKALSETDEMTNLLNKRSFLPMFNKNAEIAVKYNQTLSIMMIDSDNLKEINDKFGHGAGDKLIMNLAKTIEECLRTSDVICRYGGDEFVVLLPQLSKEEAQEAAERVRSAIENTSFDMKGQRIQSTVSIGLASYPDDLQNIYDLIDKADESLYQSKNNGRNQVINYTDLELARESQRAEDRKLQKEDAVFESH